MSATLIALPQVLYGGSKLEFERLLTSVGTGVGLLFANGSSGDGGGVFVMIGEINGVGVAVVVAVTVGVSVTPGVGVTVGTQAVNKTESAISNCFIFSLFHTKQAQGRVRHCNIMCRRLILYTQFDYIINRECDDT